MDLRQQTSQEFDSRNPSRKQTRHITLPSAASASAASTPRATDDQTPVLPMWQSPSAEEKKLEHQNQKASRQPNKSGAP